MARITSVASGRQQTSIEAIEKVALEVFAARGFEDTPVEDIAAAAGISRRTFFRYFGSKNDIPFGDYATLLDDLEQWLMSAPDDRPMFEVIAEAVQRFNRMHTDGPIAHRERMELIMHTPALRANAAIRHADWLAVVGAIRGAPHGPLARPSRPAARSAGLARSFERGVRDMAPRRVE